jgi:hypothetical protein
MASWTNWPAAPVTWNEKATGSHGERISMRAKDHLGANVMVDDPISQAKPITARITVAPGGAWRLGVAWLWRDDNDRVDRTSTSAGTGAGMVYVVPEPRPSWNRRDVGPPAGHRPIDPIAIRRHPARKGRKKSVQTSRASARAPCQDISRLFSMT